jgi:hypothetical protein
MVLVLDAIADHLGCKKVALHDYLNHPAADKKVCEFLRNKKLRTTYLSKSGEQNFVKFGGFSVKTAIQQPAYEGYLGVTVAQVYLFIFL